VMAANSHWHEENPSQSGIGGNHMYNIQAYMWLLQDMATVFSQSVSKSDHVRKGPQILVMKGNITVTHVTCFTLKPIWPSLWS
jgi:hypothetical protein